jgi:hypothetical protein
MDMTYFSFTPVSLKQRNLKIAVVFVHPAFRFEVWLAGYNKQVQQQYWKLLKESNFKKYHIPLTAPEDDSIVDYILVDNPDFNDPQALTRQIEKGTLTFIKDIEDFLAKP